LNCEKVVRRFVVFHQKLCKCFPFPSSEVNVHLILIFMTLS